MTADELRGRVDDDVEAVFDRTEQGRRQRRVVDDGRQSVLMGDGGDLLIVRHVVLRVARRLDVHGTRILVNQFADLLGSLRVEEPHFDAEFLERLCEQRPGSAIEAVGGNEVLARMHNGQQRGGNGRLAAGKRQRRRTAIERRETFFQHVGGRVHQAGVDIAELAQTEQIRRVFRVMEHVTRGRIDWHGPGRGGRVRHLTGVQRLGAQFVGRTVGRHVPFLLCTWFRSWEKSGGSVAGPNPP